MSVRAAQPHYAITYAEERVRSDYGERVSVRDRLKRVHKFGRTDNADSDTKTTVMGLQGTEVHETYSTTNDIDAAVSNDTGDNDFTLVVEGHRYDANNKLVEVSQDVAMAGQTKATLGTAMCRANRAYVKPGTFASPSTDNTGQVVIYASSGVSLVAGVPDDATAVKLVVLAGRNQSTKVATSVANRDYMFIQGAAASIERGAAGTVTGDIEMEWREQGGVWRPVGIELSMRTASASQMHVSLDQYIIMPPNADIRMVVTTNTNDVSVAGWFQAYLAQRIS